MLLDEERRFGEFGEFGEFREHRQFGFVFFTYIIFLKNIDNSAFIWQYFGATGTFKGQKLNDFSNKST